MDRLGDDSTPDPSTPKPSTPPAPGWRWKAAALVVFTLTTWFVFLPVWLNGADKVVPYTQHEDDYWRTFSRADAIVQTYIVGRNAYTFLNRPLRLWDMEHCAPEKRAISFGIPMISMGLLATPFYALTQDPILTYNLALMAMTVLAAFAMYLLVAEWTGQPAAGIAAGLLHGLDPVRLDQILHPAEWDTTWIVFAIYFARRLFAQGRWRHAVGLAAAVSLQVAASFYALVGGLFFAPPFIAWLLWTYGLTRTRGAQLAFVVITVALVAAGVFIPYLDAVSTGRIHDRSAHFFAHWWAYLPEGLLWVGGFVLVLALAGLALPRRLAVPKLDADPRWPLVIGTFLVVVMAGGPLHSTVLAALGGASALGQWNPYEVLKGVLPGLGVVRVVFRLGIFVHLTAALLAGLAIGAVICRAGRYGAQAAVVMVALAAISVLGMPWFGIERRYEWKLEPIRPRAEIVAAFAELERLGNSGPLFELPVEAGKRFARVSPGRMLLAGFHHRRTSSCYSSYTPPLPQQRDLLAELLNVNPAEATRRLHTLGFTTLVVHHPDGLAGPRRQRLMRRAERGVGRLKLILRGRELSVFEIRPPVAASAPTHALESTPAP